MSLLTVCTTTLLAASLYDAAPTDANAWLQQLPEQASYAARLAAVADALVGAPYEDGPLGEGPDGRYDQDPLVDLTRHDCVTFVEHCAAFAASPTYDEAVTLLQEIRYARGEIAFERRNHFFVADWLRNNPWCRDVTAHLGLDTVAITRTISRRDFFRRVDAPELGEDVADESVTVRLVPIDRVAEVLPALPDAALITFVGKIDWLFALHCGLYLRNSSGEGRLYHASSKAEQVVAVPLDEYCAQQRDRYVGILVHEIHTPVWPSEE